MRKIETKITIRKRKKTGETSGARERNERKQLAAAEKTAAETREREICRDALEKNELNQLAAAEK